MYFSPPDLLIMGCGLHSMLDLNLIQAPSQEKRLQEYAKQLKLIKSVRKLRAVLSLTFFSIGTKSENH